MKAKTGKMWFSDLLTATIVRKTTNRTLGKMQTSFAFALGLHTLRRTSLRLDRRRLGKMQTSFAFALGLHYLWHQIQSERK